MSGLLSILEVTEVWSWNQVARSGILGFSASMARSLTMGFSGPEARLHLMGFSRAVAHSKCENQALVLRWASRLCL
jgi:hypothetical protein